MSCQEIRSVAIVRLPVSPPGPAEGREHCRITADVAAALGIAVPLVHRVQVRLMVTYEDVQPLPGHAWFQGSTANFTVAGVAHGERAVEVYPDSPAAGGGLSRLFGQIYVPPGARVTLRNVCPSATVLDGQRTVHFPEVYAARPFEEHAATGRRELLLLAPHGGEVAPGTSEQLALLREELARSGHSPAVWECRGAWGGGEAEARWHIAAADLEPTAFPGLAHLVATHGRFGHAVALHGFDWDEGAVPRRGLVLGGRAPLTLKEALRRAIEEATGRGRIAFYVADTEGDHREHRGVDGDLGDRVWRGRLAGLEATSLLNRLSPAGLQIALSRGVRLDPGLAEAVARATGRALANLLPARQRSGSDADPAVTGTLELAMAG